MNYLKGPNIPQIVKYYDSYNDYNYNQLVNSKLRDCTFCFCHTVAGDTALGAPWQVCTSKPQRPVKKSIKPTKLMCVCIYSL